MKSVYTEALADYVKEKGINLSKLSRDTRLPYMSIYGSLVNKQSERDLRVGEFFTICKFIGANPMDFADDSERGEK